jgi:coenzyme F420 hydrogenase subunit beta
MAPTARFERITEDAMCIGCGLCQGVAGEGRIRMHMVSSLTPRPVVHQELDAETVDRIYRLCPGTRVEGLPEHLIESDSVRDGVWGVWRRMALAWAAEPEIRHMGSTGGVLTALALYLVESGEVDFIVHARASGQYPAYGECHVSRDRSQVLKGAGSRYAPTATLVDIQGILERCRKEGETFAFIGTPCDVTALRNLAAEDPGVDRLCRFQLAMVCGGFMAPEALFRFLDGLDVARDDLSALRYRGYGCPGSTRIETRDGRVIERNYLDFWGEDESAWQLPFRCKICPDGIGEAADIAVSDTWEGGSPPRQGQENDPGSNALIARSAGGQALAERAVAAGYLEVGDSLTPRDMDRFQPHQVARKRAAWSRFVGMRNAGRIVPDVARLRLKPLAGENSLAENLSQARGAKRRCLEPGNRESPPEPID